MALSSSDNMVNACMAATCDKCGKTTWRGCGKHIDSVMANVPKEQQCTCPRS